MHNFSHSLPALLSIALVATCMNFARADQTADGPRLPEPFATKSVIKHPKVIGWPEQKTPQALQGIRVTAFASQIDNPFSIETATGRPLDAFETSPPTNRRPGESLDANSLGQSRCFQALPRHA